MTIDQFALTALGVVAWYGTGYLPGRRIKRKVNRWHAWGPFGQVWGFIDGDIESWLPDAMPWPFGKAYINLSFTQYVEDGDGNPDDHTGLSEDGQEIHYHKALPKVLGTKKQIRLVTERVTRIRKEEIHPYQIKQEFLCGSTFYLDITSKIKVEEPMKMKQLDNSLVAFGNELNDAVYPWGPEQEDGPWKKEAKRRNIDVKDVVLQKMFKLRIDATRSIMVGGIDLKTYMNVNKGFHTKYGMFLEEFSVDMGYDEHVKTIRDKRNDQKIEEENTVLEEKKSLKEDVIRTRNAANRAKEIEQDALEVTDVYKPLLKALGKKEAKANAAWKDGVTVITETQASTAQQATIFNKLLNKKIGNNGTTNSAATPGPTTP